MQSKNFQTKVWKVSLENTTTWKVKSLLAFKLNLFAPNSLAQIRVQEIHYGSSMTDSVYKNGATVKNVKRHQPAYLECVCCHEIPAFKAFQLNFKARLSWNIAVLELFAMEFKA